MEEIQGTVETRIRNELGYADLENQTVKCADCNKKLLLLKKVKESNKEELIQVQCICGGTSFKVRLHGVYYFLPVETLNLLDIKDGLFIMGNK